MKLNDIKRLFHKKGLRLTQQRQFLLHLLANSDQPLPVEELFIHFLNNSQKVSLSTIYRSLEVLVEHNFVDKTILYDDNKAYYSLHQGHRHFITCLSCKTMTEIEHCPIKQIEETIADKTNFQVMDHKLELYGLCPECQ